MEAVFRVISNVLLCLSIGAFSAGCESGSGGNIPQCGGGVTPPDCSGRTCANVARICKVYETRCGCVPK